MWRSINKVVCTWKYPQKRYISGSTVMMHTTLLSASAFKLFFITLAISVPLCPQSPMPHVSQQYGWYNVSSVPLGYGWDSVPLQCVHSLSPSLSSPLLSPPSYSSLNTPSFQWTQPTAQQGLGLSTTTEVCGNQPQVSGVYIFYG